MANKKVVFKPSKDVVKKHVALMEKLAKKNKGQMPTYTWLEKHGYFHSYEVMRAVPRAFKHIKRQFLRG